MVVTLKFQLFCSSYSHHTISVTPPMARPPLASFHRAASRVYLPAWSRLPNCITLSCRPRSVSRGRVITACPRHAVHLAYTRTCLTHLPHSPTFPRRKNSTAVARASLQEPCLLSLVSALSAPAPRRPPPRDRASVTATLATALSLALPVLRFPARQSAHAHSRCL